MYDSLIAAWFCRAVIRLH